MLPECQANFCASGVTGFEAFMGSIFSWVRQHMLYVVAVLAALLLLQLGQLVMTTSVLCVACRRRRDRGVRKDASFVSFPASAPGLRPCRWRSWTRTTSGIHCSLRPPRPRGGRGGDYWVGAPGSALRVRGSACRVSG